MLLISQVADAPLNPPLKSLRESYRCGQTPALTECHVQGCCKNVSAGARN